MIAKNYIELPSEGLVRGSILDEGDAVTVYLDIHKEKTWQQQDGNEEPTEKEITVGYPVRCDKPFGRDTLINAAEMTAYGLRDAMASASYNASLARKWRENPGDEEVKEHDEFIEWVKEQLTKIGVK